MKILLSRIVLGSWNKNLEQFWKIDERTYRFSRRTPALRRGAVTAVSAQGGIWRWVYALKVIDGGAGIILRRFDVHLVIRVLVFIRDRLWSWFLDNLSCRLGTGWPGPNYRTEGRLVQRRGHWRSHWLCRRCTRNRRGQRSWNRITELHSAYMKENGK